MAIHDKGKRKRERKPTNPAMYWRWVFGEGVYKGVRAEGLYGSAQISC